MDVLPGSSSQSGLCCMLVLEARKGTLVSASSVSSRSWLLYYCYRPFIVCRGARFGVKNIPGLEFGAGT